MNPINGGIAGAVLGGLVGFLLRPSAFLVGQLPFGDVITRGRSLTGLAVLLIPTAQTSFNYMVVGLIFGGVIGVVFGTYLARRG